MGIGSRLFRTSESRPSVTIRPVIRQSSVIPSNGMPDGASIVGSAAADSLPLPRFRNPNGMSFLRGARVLADGVDDRFVGECRRVAEHPAFRDIAEQPAHDLARARLR